MTYIVSALPSVEPVLAVDFREFHTHVSDSTEEAGLNELVTAVRQYLERRYDKAIITQTIAEGFNYWQCLDLTISPVASITKVEYYNDTDVLTLLSSTKYQLIKGRTYANMVFTEAMDYPQLSTRLEPVLVTYVAGEATAAANIKQHIRQCVARLYYDKETFESVMDNVELIFPELRIMV